MACGRMIKRPLPIIWIRRRNRNERTEDSFTFCGAADGGPAGCGRGERRGVPLLQRRGCGRRDAPRGGAFRRQGGRGHGAHRRPDQEGRRDRADCHDAQLRAAGGHDHRHLRSRGRRRGQHRRALRRGALHRADQPLHPRGHDREGLQQEREQVCSSGRDGVSELHLGRYAPRHGPGVRADRHRL